jgi:hypothetical protein
MLRWRELMAFVVHCGRCRLPASRCRSLLAQWHRAAARRGAFDHEQALSRLPTVSPELLACLGLQDAGHARGWLAAGRDGTSTALSLQMLEWTTPLPTLPPQTWHAMANDAATAALPASLARRVAAGASLAQWLGSLTGKRMHSPADAHLGGWVRGRTALRLLQCLRPSGANADHDAIRRMLDGLSPDDWLLVNAVW